MAFVIPSIFTVVDKYSATVTKMTGVTNAFSASGDKVKAAFSGVVATSMLSLGAAFVYAGKGVADFESEIANLVALTGISGGDIDKFQKKVIGLAKEMQYSAVDVAKGFTIVANQMPALLKDIEGLGNVTKSAITLSRAAKIDLATSADALTTVLNHFGLAANQSTRAIDAMAQASKVGSSEIKDTTEALRKFASFSSNVAKATLEETLAMVQLVSAYEKGAFAGDKLRNIMIKIATAGSLENQAMKSLSKYNVNTRLVADSTQSLYVRLKELSKIAGSASAMKEVFDAENINVASALLKNLDKMPELLLQITKNSEGAAMAMAKVNTNTFYGAFEKMRAAFMNVTIDSKNANFGLRTLSKSMLFLADNMDTVVSVGALLLGSFLAYKTVVIGTTFATTGFTAAVTAMGIVEGFVATKTNTLTYAMLDQKAALLGASIAMGDYNAKALTVLSTLGKITAALVFVTAAFSMFDNASKKDDERNARRDAILKHLPSGVSFEKAKEEMDYLRFSLDRTPERQAMFEKYDSIGRKYYDEPKRMVDSANNPQQADYYEQAQQLKQQINLNVHVDKNGNVTTTGTTNDIPLKVTNSFMNPKPYLKL